MLNVMAVAMTEPRKLRCYGYVERPYEQVRGLLRQHALELLQRATTSASERASSLAANLKLGVAGIEVGVDVRTYLQRIREDEGICGLPPVTTLEIGWEARQTPAFFPIMRAEVSFWPLASDETEIEITGDYRPPLGAIGDAADAALGHRIAEAVVHRFLGDVVAELHRELPETHERAGAS
jgi:hypothetical protein